MLFEQLSLGGKVWAGIRNTSRWPWGVGTAQEVVRTVAVPEIIVVPRFALRSGPALNRVMIEQHLDRARVAVKTARILVGVA